LVDKKLAKECIEKLLIAIGENPDREGLRNTPDRVVNMFEEVFMGIGYTNDEIAEKFDVTFEDELEFENNNVVILKDISLFSFCEHHMALMYEMKISVGYIPQNKVIGLSKIVRICDLVCRRLQIQERINQDIAYILKKILGTDDVAVIINATHSCMTVRGIKNNSTRTKTITYEGCFKTDLLLQSQILD
jgi:GTP cyclohydrolase I